MERKHNCKRMVAWLLTIAMVFGNSSFAALAEEAAPAETAAVQAEAIQTENTVPAGDAAAVETSEFAPAEDAAIAEAPEDAAEENTAAAEKEDALIEEEAAAPEEGSEADVPVEEAAPEAEGILLEGMEVVPEGLAPMAEEGEDEEEPRRDVLALSWEEYGEGGNERDEKGNLLDPDCVYYGTWVFPDSTVTLNVEGLKELEALNLGEYKLQVRTFLYNPETDELTDARNYLTADFSEENETITVTGCKVTGDDLPGIVELQVLDEEGNLAVVAGKRVPVIEPTEKFRLNNQYQNTVFPDDCYYPEVSYQIQTPEHPYWDENMAKINEIKVTEQYTVDGEGKETPADGVVVDVRPDEEGNWYLEAGQSLGYANFTVSFFLADDEDETHSYETEGTVYVSGDVWNLDFEYPNYEDDSMLPGDTMTIHTTLYHEWRHGDDWDNKEAEDYELSVVPKEQQGPGTLEVSVDGQDIIVKAGDDECWRSFEAVATVDGKEVARNSFSVNVQADGYSLLRVDNMDQVNNLAPGKSVTIDPELVFISPKGDETVQEGIKYCMDEFDPDILSVTDVDGKDLLAGSEDGKPVIGTAPLTITKKTNDNTDAKLIAMSMNEDGDYEERYRIDLHFWEQDCSVRYVFDGADGDGYNWSVPIFNDEDKVIKADTSRLQEMGVDYEIVWKVGRIEDGDWQISNPLPADGGYYTAEGDTIILHGAKLAQKYPPFNGEGDDNSRFDLRVQVLVNGTSVWENDGPGFEMREPQEWFNPPLQGMNDNQTFPNGTIQFDAKTTCYMQNAMYPDGVELSATITDVKIIKNMTWTDEGDIEVKDPIFTVEGSADDGWALRSGGEYGFAYLEFTYEVRPDPNSPEKIVGTYGSVDDDDCFEVDVTGEKQHFELVDTEGDILVSPGVEKTIFTKAWKEFLDEDGKLQTEVIEDYELRFTDGERNPLDDQDEMSVTDNKNGSFTVIVNEERGWESGLIIRCMVQMEGDDEPWSWSDLWMNVRVGCTDDEHEPGEWKVTVVPTCTDAGMQTLYCEYCGYKLDEKKLEATGHTEVEKLTKAPTCTAPGEKTFTCEKCGELLRTEVVKAIDHSWGAWSAPTEATIFAASTRSRTCTVCKKQETQTVGAKLTPVLKLTANSLKMKTKQTTKKFLVTEIANGDSVASVTSSNAKVLKVKAFNSGTGTFTLAAQKKKGKANLTITLASGLSKTIKVTVQSAKVKTTKVALDKASKKITLSKGKKYTLKPTVTPVTSQDKISYTSSNKAVAAVSSKGVITAKKKGKAKITIKSGKKKVVCTVTVK